MADARRIRVWRSQGLEVFGYFNNDAHGYAPRNAMRLRELVGRPRTGRYGHRQTAS